MSNSTVLRFKKELRTTTELMELIDVLKRVAASQFHGIEEKRLKSGGDSARPPVILEDFFQLIPLHQRMHPFLGAPSEPLGLLVVTSDKGFLGGLNASVIQKALLSPGGERADLMVVGERGKLYLTDLRKRFTYFPREASDTDDQAAARLRDCIADRYLEGSFRRVLVFYPRFISFTHQEVDSFQLLPYELPLKGNGGADLKVTETILEPSAYSIIEYLIRLLLVLKIKEVFWQSRLSELAARTTYLETSFQKLQDLRKKLLFQYFRSKHEATDTSIRESYAGLLLQRKKGKALSDPELRESLEDALKAL